MANIEEEINKMRIQDLQPGGSSYKKELERAVLSDTELHTDELAQQKLGQKCDATGRKLPKATDMWQRIAEMMDQEITEGRSLESLVNEAFLMAMVFLAKSDQLNVQLRTDADERFMNCTQEKAAKYKAYVPSALTLTQVVIGGVAGYGAFKGDKSLDWVSKAGGVVDPIQKLHGSFSQAEHTMLDALRDISKSASGSAQSETQRTIQTMRNTRDLWTEFFRQLMQTKAQLLSR